MFILGYTWIIRNFDRKTADTCTQMCIFTRRFQNKYVELAWTFNATKALAMRDEVDTDF